MVTDLADDVVRARFEAATTVEVRAGGRLGPERHLRDPRADEQYFDELLVHRAEGDRSVEKRVRVIAPGTERVWLRGRDAINARWASFSVYYSQGAPIDVLRAEFLAILATIERALELLSEHPSEATSNVYRTSKDFYRYWLVLVSLALALRVDDSVFDRVVAATVFGHGDRLIDRLIASRRPAHPIGADLRFARIVERLDRAFDAAAPNTPIADYLDRWYALWKGIQGWDGHEFVSKKHYSGYWAFEVVGVVIALDLDDSAFRDLEYYPDDLGGMR